MCELQTSRLVLRSVTAAEAERIVAGTPEPTDRWAPGYPFAGDVTAARGFLKVCAEHGDPQPFGMYIIHRIADGLAIGGIGFHSRPSEDGAVSVGYGLISSERGMGYAAEALRRLLEFARERGVRRVVADTTHDNVASQRVMAAAGMRQTGADERLVWFSVDWPEPAARDAG